MAGSRRRLVTPVLVLDLDRLEANIRTMASIAVRAASRCVRTPRPTKSVNIARRQMAAAPIGICCATIGEAEIMARAGIEGLLVTSPVVQPANIARSCICRDGARADGGGGFTPRM